VKNEAAAITAKTSANRGKDLFLAARGSIGLICQLPVKRRMAIRALAAHSFYLQDGNARFGHTNQHNRSQRTFMLT
jgi:hypothetical protein